MKPLRFLIIFFLVLTIGGILSVLLIKTNIASDVFAVEDCGEQDIDCVGKKIEEYKQKISELQGQQKTLSSTISYLNNKIALTGGEIKKTELEIALLERQITELSGKIEGLEVSLKKLTEVLVERIRENYKQRAKSPMLVLFSSEDFGDFFTRYKYMQLAQKHLEEIVQETEQQKVVFDQEKQTKEEKQSQVLALQKKLELQKVTLDQQKSQKQTILTATKNDEQKYQSLLQQALAEKNALEAALVSGTKVGPVKKGDPIALVGNSGYPGCSTGEHLHFEIRKDNQWVDPANYLQSKTVSDEEKGGSTTLGNGPWDWPIQDEIRLTQHYGQTPYSWRYKYSGGIHTGYDMVSKSSKVIRAPADGTLYSSSQACGSSSTINIKYIEHGDGVISFYLHVQ